MRSFIGTSSVIGSVILFGFLGCGGSDADPNDGGVEDAAEAGPPPIIFSEVDATAEAGPSTCGDAELQPGEGCDDGNANGGDGCSPACAIEAGFVCPVPGGPCAPATKCGDGLIQGAEQCDDGDTKPLDGCSATCTLESGWVCPVPGAGCFAANCGDGILAGDEECDDGPGKADAGVDGCSATCRLLDGFKCPTPGTPCVPIQCGDGVVEGTEQCDDGELKPGALGYLRPYDGCDTTCKREPTCKETVDGGVVIGACQGLCGDGVVFPGEACDDGNKRDGDGCGGTCAKEVGFDCTDAAQALPAFLDLPLIIRDIRGFTDSGGTRHPDFEKSVMTPACPGDNLITGMLGPLFTTRLDAEGRPVYVGAGLSGSDCVRGGPTGFAKWYRDTAGVNTTLIKTLRLTKQANDSYVFGSAIDEPYKSRGGFFPIDNEGFGNQGASPNHNYHFTSEVKYWFTYSAAATPPLLEFTGDDDVWVFINGRLAVDIGGIHSVQGGQITLNAANAASLGLADGRLYEITVFQAERNRTGSNYKLTLRGFEQKRTTCVSKCGDGIKTKFEACDDGANNDTNGPVDGGATVPPAYGKCSFDCRLRGGYCGDGIVQTAAGETCDLGAQNGTYGPNSCRVDCKGPGPRCGDGKVDVFFNESCDDANLVSGDGCSSTCARERQVK